MTVREAGRLLMPLRWIVLGSSLVACSGDCIYYPCPEFEAAEISVTATGATAGIPGLTVSLSGAIGGTEPCPQGTGGVSVCYIPGGPGEYQARLTAPGYQTVDIKFTVTGTSAGCNTCGHVDRQMLSVVMQPASA